MSVQWTDEEIQLLEALRPVCNTREIQQVFENLNLERSMEAIAKKSRQFDIKFKDFGVPVMNKLTDAQKGAIEKVIEERGVRIEMLEPLQEISPAKKAVNTMKMKEAMFDIMNGLQEIRGQVPRIQSISTKRATGPKKSGVLLMSDNHIGAQVKDDTGKSIYNVNIAVERIENTPELLLSTVSPGTIDDMDELVIILAGDHIDGEGVYPGQEHNLQTHVADQVKHCTKAFWSMIKKFRMMMPDKLVRIVTTRGNHGRGGTSPESNWDVMVFQQLELLVDLEEDSSLTIKNRYGEYNVLEVKGWKGLIRHKAPVQADTGAAVARYAGWHGIHGWDFFCYGHWHHWGVMTWNGKPIFRNGSVMGGNDYAEGFAAYDRPTQLFFTVSEEKLPIGTYTLYY